MTYTLTEHIADNDDVEFQKRLNIALAGLVPDAEILDVKYSSTSAGADNCIIYSALIIYRVEII